MYSCFQGLNPRTLIGMVKGSLRSGGIPVPQVDAAPVKEERNGRYILKSRLTARLGLTEYNHSAPLDESEYNPKKVKLLLSQHIGKAAEPTVKMGDTVKVGDLIAATDENALGVAIHSSINGLVTDVTDKYIVITAN